MGSLVYGLPLYSYQQGERTRLTAIEILVIIPSNHNLFQCKTLSNMVFCYILGKDVFLSGWGGR